MVPIFLALRVPGPAMLKRSLISNIFLAEKLTLLKQFWYVPPRALPSRYFVLVFQCESLAKKEEMQCSFKVPQAYRSPTGFSFNFFAALKIPLSSRKKWCFQKQAKNLKTCYVLHCRRMQRCWALWTLSGWHKYIFIISTPKSTNHSRASVEGREMYSLSYLDDRFYL